MTIADGSAIALSHEVFIFALRFDDNWLANSAVLINRLSQRFNLVFCPNHFIQSCWRNIASHLPDEILDTRIAGVQLKLIVRNTADRVGDLLALDYSVLSAHSVAP